MLYGMRADAYRSARRIRWDKAAQRLGLQTSSDGTMLLMTGELEGAQLEIEEDIVTRDKRPWLRTTVRVNLVSLNAPEAQYRQAMVAREPSLFDSTEVEGDWLCGSVMRRSPRKVLRRMALELRKRAIAERFNG